MLTIRFDFHRLHSRQDFYHHLVEHSHCDIAFGDNLDALWDWLTGGMSLPATFELQDLQEISEPLRPVLTVIEQAARELDGLLTLHRTGKSD